MISFTIWAACMGLGTIAGEPTQLAFISTGAASKSGGYVPQRITLQAEPPVKLVKSPAGLDVAMYGELKLGPRESPTSILFVLSEREGSPSRLWVDANGNGDLTDDAAPLWEPKEYKGRDNVTFTQSSGSAVVKVNYGSAPVELGLKMYRFDPKDPGRVNMKNILFYYGDYGLEGTVKVGERDLQALLVDRAGQADFRGVEGGRPATGVVLLLDVNGNGKFDRRGEMFDVRLPFNLAGTTYELKDLAADGRTFSVVKSEKTVPEVPVSPDLSVGKAAPQFKDTLFGTSKEVSFPQSYKGKLVLLDFWATWCGPCIADLPHLLEAYDKFHQSGLEVLGISLDQEKKEEHLSKFLADRKMAWPQVYDGKYWESRIGQLYGVDSIPRAILVDGDTGLIVAEGAALRGPRIAETVAKALEAKKGRQQ